MTQPPRHEPLKDYFPLRFDDFKRKTRALDFEMRWRYLTLLNFLYQEGGYIEDDDALIAEAAGIEKTKQWRKKVGILRSFLAEENGFLTQKTVLEILAKAAEIREKRKTAGKAGGEANAKRLAEQSKLKPKRVDTPQQQSPMPREAAAVADDGRKPWTAFIATFDDILGEVWGENHRRPWPHGGDGGTAQGWLERGWAVEEVADALEMICRRMQAQGKAPPRTLSYFTAAVEEHLRAIAEGRETAAMQHSEAQSEWYEREPVPREQLLEIFKRLGHFGKLEGDAALLGLTPELAEAEIQAQKAEKEGRVQ